MESMATELSSIVDSSDTSIYLDTQSHIFQQVATGFDQDWQLRSAATQNPTACNWRKVRFYGDKNLQIDHFNDTQ